MKNTGARAHPGVPRRWRRRQQLSTRRRATNEQKTHFQPIMILKNIFVWVDAYFANKHKTAHNRHDHTTEVAKTPRTVICYIIAVGIMIFLIIVLKCFEDNGKNNTSKTFPVSQLASSEGVSYRQLRFHLNHEPVAPIGEENMNRLSSSTQFCPPPGCLYCAQNIEDIHAKQGLKRLQEGISETTTVKSANIEQEEGLVSSKVGSSTLATLTFTSNRESKTNQDRGFVIYPFRITDKELSLSHTQDLRYRHEHDFIVGIFDGHSDLGHLVAQQARDELGPTFVKELKRRAGSVQSNVHLLNKGHTANHHTSIVNKMLPPAEEKEEDVIQLYEILHDHPSLIRQALKDTFRFIDANIPHETSLLGGCTASVAVRFGNRIHIANAGDSRTMIMAHVVSKSSKTNTNNHNEEAPVQDFVIYANRLDKPHLSDEHERITSMGGTVFTPKPPKSPMLSRTIVFSSKLNENVGLAMSRSLGDIEFTQKGVTPEPLVDSLSLSELIQRSKNVNTMSKQQALKSNQFIKLDLLIPENVSEHVTNDGDKSSFRNKNKDDHGDDQYEFYVVSISDGLSDARRPSFIAHHLGQLMYNGDINNVSQDQTVDHKRQNQHNYPISLACRSLIDLATPPQTVQPPIYRDDITISVIKVLR